MSAWVKTPAGRGVTVALGYALLLAASLGVGKLVTMLAEATAPWVGWGTLVVILCVPVGVVTWYGERGKQRRRAAKERAS